MEDYIDYFRCKFCSSPSFFLPAFNIPKQLLSPLRTLNSRLGNMHQTGCIVSSLSRRDQSKSIKLFSARNLFWHCSTKPRSIGLIFAVSREDVWDYIFQYVDVELNLFFMKGQDVCVQFEGVLSENSLLLVRIKELESTLSKCGIKLNV